MLEPESSGLTTQGQLYLRADGVDVHAVALDEHPRRGLDAQRRDDALVGSLSMAMALPR